MDPVAAPFGKTRAQKRRRRPFPRQKWFVVQDEAGRIYGT